MEFDVVEIISKIAGTFASSWDSPGSLNEIMKVVTSEMRGVRSYLLLTKPESQSLAPVASHGLGVAEFRRLEPNSETAIFRNVMESDDPAFISRVNREGSLAFLHHEHEASLFIVPVKFGRKTLGLRASLPRARGQKASDSRWSFLSLSLP